jgi:adenosylcobinamide-phosphate synthase
VLAAAMLLDLALGDPDYAWHPVRLIGRMLLLVERALRRLGLDGYGGGILLFLVLAGVWMAGVSALTLAAGRASAWLGVAVHLFFLYSLLALGSLLRHGRRIETALRAGDLPRARAAVSQLVGRDTDPMDAAACRRAAVESLSENLTDGVVSPLFWYAIGGLPLLVLFKVVSTMDSMVGYKTPEYLRLGWCGARLDDVMNYLPARVTWLLIAGAAAVLPGCSARKAWTIGLSDHGVLPSPNSGWSEAAAAGALQCRLIGPIWNRGRLVTDVWIGAPADPPLSTARDYERAARLVAACGLLAAVLAGGVASLWPAA